MFKVVMKYPNGERDELEEVFETEEAARDHGLYECDSYVAGAEVLHMSNPGDHPMDEDEAFEGVDFEVIEVKA